MAATGAAAPVVSGNATTYETDGNTTVVAHRDVFESCLWGDFFVNYTPPSQACSILTSISEEWMRERADQLNEQVRRVFETTTSMTDAVTLVDTLKHLGIDLRFREEIDSVLGRVHRDEDLEFATSDDLHIVALRFRLLRQHGYWVSADVFDKFRDDGNTNGGGGSFSTVLCGKTRDLLSLYNAAHMAIPGEEALDEAIAFAKQHLEAAVNKGELKSPMAEQVSRALDIPLPRFMPRVETTYYMAEYEQEETHDAVLLELAKLDFNLVRAVHLKELTDISLWEESAVSVVPDYLRALYLQTLKHFNEFEAMLKPHEKHRMVYLIKEYKMQSRHYVQEARWSNEKNMPTFKEHREVSAMTSFVAAMCLIALIFAEGQATEEAIEWALGMPDMYFASGEIGRFLNDVASYKMGKNKKDVASSVECYAQEHGVTGDEAAEAIAEMVELAWRRINKGALEMGRALLPAARIVTGMSSTVEVMYLGGRDGYTFGRDIKDIIVRLFVDPVPV
nr:unnamed protein product [Digitaria exilis]